MKNSTTSLDRVASTLRRRWFFQQCGVGMAGLAAASFDRAASVNAGELENPLKPKQPHFEPRAKRVIYLFQAGAPSQLELFDEKPQLVARDGELPPASLLENYRAAFIDPNSELLGPRYKFKSFGECGMRLSELLPYLGGIADDICLIRSMHTEAVNHAPGQIMMNTGSQQFGRPSFGSWTIYGLGSVADDLPGFVVLTSAKGTSGGASNYGGGFLPTLYGGTPFRNTGDPVLFLSNPKGIDRETQRASLDALNRLNQEAFESVGDPEIQSRIQSYEMAFELQKSAPELMDINSEPRHVLERYGIKDPNEASYARNCLLARRLVERDVRFVQLFHEVWDQPGSLKGNIKKNAEQTDQASAALVSDLKERGLLEDTVIIWGGEFGRTPMGQTKDGRDHHNRCFSLWLAGGGVRSGCVHGSTDDFGFNVSENPVHVHDLHATLLYLLGLDHTKLTYRFQGRDFRLTDVHGRVLHDLLV